MKSSLGITASFLVLTSQLTQAAPTGSPGLSRRQSDLWCFNIGTDHVIQDEGVFDAACGGFNSGPMELHFRDAGTVTLIFRISGSGSMNGNDCRNAFRSIRDACTFNGNEFRGGKITWGGMLVELDPQPFENAGLDIHQGAPSPPADQPQTPNPPAPQGGFAQQILERHNFYRAKHGAGPLEWDDGLAARALSNAQTCTGHLEHGGTGPGEGQNLAGGSDAVGSVKMWYDEVGKYDMFGLFDREATDADWKQAHDEQFCEKNEWGYCIHQWGHFTLVVWKSTTKLGCAQHDCGGDNGNRVTCNYLMAGGSPGYLNNVGRATS